MREAFFKRIDESKRLKINDFVKKFAPFLGLLVIVLFFQIATKGKLISARNFPVFINYAFPLIIAACGGVFLMAQGNLDFSMAANVCLSAAVGALASRISPLLAIPSAILVSMLLGLINGVAHVFLGLPAFIATLAASYMYEGVAKVILGGGSIAANFALKSLDTTFVKYSIVILIVLGAFAFLELTAFGRHCKGIGAKDEVVRQSGVNVKQKKIIAFMISGGVCGVVAIFSLIRTCTASINTGAGVQFNTLLALMLGGIPFSGGWSSKFRCVVIGSLMMAVVENGLILMAVPSLNQQIIKGLLFLIAVAVSFDRKNTAVVK